MTSWKTVSLLALLIFISSGAFFYFYSLHIFYSPGPLEDDKVIYIKRGMPFSEISKNLQQDGLIKSALLFGLQSRLRGTSQKVKAGEYLISKGSSPSQILNHITSGQVIQHTITIPEGLKIQEINDLIMQAPLLDTKVMPEIQEGEILAETYHYTWGETADNLIKRMKKEMGETSQKAWAERNENSILKSPEELIILASIIEKETSIDDERPHVAGVFINRLKIGLPLQTDPTVIYGLEELKGEKVSNLSREDLKVLTKYNTYLIKGLPPGPICCPGKASIRAAANPLVTDDLYFVANGTGGHTFAKTYKEHLINQKKWRKIRAENRN